MITPSTVAEHTTPAVVRWTSAGRALVFLLASTSIWCLLAEMYGLLEMRTFFFFIFLPASLLLYGIAAFDRARGDGRLWRAVVVGTTAGLVGAVAYDIFRLPFVYSQVWGLEAFGIPSMPLFKVFPCFGALILGEPQERPSHSLGAYLLGWAYHFSNGATFGVMFASMAAGAGEAFGAATGRRLMTTLHAILMATGIEICLLVSPYAQFFGINMTRQFILVTLMAHIIFGFGLGQSFAWHTTRWRLLHVT